ncbi:MAG: DUF3883 domain-containing protein [Leptospirales bacterium]
MSQYINRNQKLTNREKLILTGLFLAKFDRDGLEALGFNSFSEAFNTIAFSLNAQPASIKNYRDEFDPYFPNARSGWHKRSMRSNCQNIFDIYCKLNKKDFVEILRLSISELGELESIEDQLANYSQNTFAKRLITGQAAEHYFERNYQKETYFQNCTLTNTTKWGCGFDFKIDILRKPFIAVEVKGLANKAGNIQLTAKEYQVARLLKNRFFLYIVHNFKEYPYHTVYKNPLNSKLNFSSSEVTNIQINWNANIGSE